MIKQMNISIPKPCHENWDAMTKNIQGAYCKSCCKNVIDFSNKTENEIYNIISNAEGEMCGRFTEYQLQHPIRKTEVNNGWFNWKAIAASLAGFLSFDRINASADVEPKPKTETKAITTPGVVITTSPTIKHQSYTTVGVMVMQKPEYPIQPIDLGIRGRVVDGNSNEPLMGATIQIKNTGTSATADSHGNFIIRSNADKWKGDTLVVQYPGYITKEFPLSSFKEGSIVKLELKERMRMGDFVVGEMYAMPVKGKMKLK